MHSTEDQNFNKYEDDSSLNNVVVMDEMLGFDSKDNISAVKTSPVEAQLIDSKDSIHKTDGNHYSSGRNLNKISEVEGESRSNSKIFVNKNYNSRSVLKNSDAIDINGATGNMMDLDVKDVQISEMND